MPRDVNNYRYNTIDEVLSNLGGYSYYWDDPFSSLIRPRQTRRTQNTSISLRMVYFSIIKEIDVHRVSGVRVFDIKLKTIGTNNRNFYGDKEDNNRALEKLERLKKEIKPNEIFNLRDCKGNLIEVID